MLNVMPALTMKDVKKSGVGNIGSGTLGAMGAAQVRMVNAPGNLLIYG